MHSPPRRWPPQFAGSRGPVTPGKPSHFYFLLPASIFPTIAFIPGINLSGANQAVFLNPVFHYPPLRLQRVSYHPESDSNSNFGRYHSIPISRSSHLLGHPDSLFAEGHSVNKEYWVGDPASEIKEK